MNIEDAERIAARAHNYYETESDPKDRFESAMAALRAIDGLLCTTSAGENLHMLNADDLCGLLRMVGREFQIIYNAQRNS